MHWERDLVRIDRVSEFTVENTLKMVKLEWKSMPDKTEKRITQVSD